MKVRNLIIATSLVFLPLGILQAQVNFNIGTFVPGASLGIDMPTYPRMVQIPGNPVYYNPQLNANYFFYDGMYWLFKGDRWYSGSWYNGPWQNVGPNNVPLAMWRVPVRYYRQPPGYFRGWSGDKPPRWDDHWGPEWSQQRKGWDKWDKRSVPRVAPLPVYQRDYSRNHYPDRYETQNEIRSQHYRYQPHESVNQQNYQMPHNEGGKQDNTPQQKSQDNGRGNGGGQGGGQGGNKGQGGNNGHGQNR